MFKIESYVTPILLSYVDKYVRDFKPADAQVSLWGGGVALHNLVLKADVLQQEVALPFTLVSGRIHELLIQVPWTKIMSEPIVITIDTIECVLNLNPPDPQDDNLPPEPPRRTQVVEAPPGYMQALVRRIVSNIALRVHHLIVKYVQDDIVLSLNVKHLAVDSAGPTWEPAFADIEQSEPVLRRLVRLDDVTLCLDRADSDGKIRFYQEPLLYRCQLDLRVLTRLVSASTRRATGLSVHVRSAKLAWGVTSEQLVLLLRLMSEGARHQPRQPPPAPKAASQVMPAHPSEPARAGSWSEWAWSWLPSWAEGEGGAEEAPAPAAPIPVALLAYLDDVSLVLKVMEVEGSNRKRARPVLEISAWHAAMKWSVRAPTLMRVQVGLRRLAVVARGRCPCGHVPTPTVKEEPTIYLSKTEDDPTDQLWSWPESNPIDAKVELAQVADEALDNATPTVPKNPSLADESDTEGQEGDPAEDQGDPLWQHMAPVVFLDYCHERSPPLPYTNPYENPPIDFQYSDWVEVCTMRVRVRPMSALVCVGLLHRLRALRTALGDIPPSTAPDLPTRTLTVEECDALMENLPQKRISVEMSDFRVRLVPWEHAALERSPATAPASASVPASAALEVELPRVVLMVTGPLYPHRVCSAACQLPEDSGPVCTGARLRVSISACGAHAKLAGENGTRPCARAHLRAVAHKLLHPEMFPAKSVALSYTVKMREVSVCGSSARLQAAAHVVSSLANERMSPILQYSTLVRDAFNDEESVAIDLTAEELSARGYLTDDLHTHILSLQSARGTVYQPAKEKEVAQAWLFSAPETSTTTPFLRVATQWCSSDAAGLLEYLGVWTEPVAFSADPLFIAWLAYKPATVAHRDSHTSLNTNTSTTQFGLRRLTTPTSSSGRAGSRAGSGAELVHVRPRSAGSSSEHGERRDSRPHPPAVKAESKPWDGGSVVAAHERLRRALVSVELGLALVYASGSSASALDCATVHDALERHAATADPVLALSLGRISLNSSAAKKQLWQVIRHDGPTYIDGLDNTEGDSFPWKLRLADVSCYTLGIYSTTDKPSQAPFGQRSQLKVSEALHKPVLEMVTTTVTISVVTKSLHVKTTIKKENKESVSEEPDKTKYFTTGLDFKPSSLKEFFRGPANRKKTNTEAMGEADRQPEPAAAGGPLVSLGVHVHADTPPIIVRLDDEQIHLVATAVHGFQHILALLHSKPFVPPRNQPVATFAPTRCSLIRSVSEIEETQTPSEDTLSENPSKSRSELISIYESYAASKPSTKVKTFFWFQWVVSRATLVVASRTVKLAFDMDDIISTVDLQAHYNQLKVKVASASVRHYQRTGSHDWTAGVLGGRVLEAREPNNVMEENHFMSVTVTQAQISNLPTNWKEELPPKLLEEKSESDTMWEIYATVAPLEAVLQPDVLRNITSLAKEFAPRSFCPLQDDVAETRCVSFQWPTCYVNAGGLRLLLTSDHDERAGDDTFILQVSKLTVNPYPDNPICRRPVNTASDMNWMGGRNLFEGQQYEVLVHGFAIKSAQLHQIACQEVSENELLKGTGGENPALKWTQPVVAPLITTLLHNVDVGVVVAPAVWAGGVVATGPALELNLVSDCALDLGLPQLGLAAALAAAFLDDRPGLILTKESQCDVCPFAPLLIRADDAGFYSGEYMVTEDIMKSSRASAATEATDSGVDTVTSHSTLKTTSRFEDSAAKKTSVVFVDHTVVPSDYLEVFVTMGVIDVSLYVADDGDPSLGALRPPAASSVAPPAAPDPAAVPAPDKVIFEDTMRKEDDVNSVGSGTKSVLSDSGRDSNVFKTNLRYGKHTDFHYAKKEEGSIPLLHLTLHQPNFYYWKRKTQKNFQVSLFNLWAGLGSAAGAGRWSAPLVASARGAPDPATDIPPALATARLAAPAHNTGATKRAASPGKTRGKADTALLNHSPIRPRRGHVHTERAVRRMLLGNQRGSIQLDVERPVQLTVCADRVRRIQHILALARKELPPSQQSASSATAHTPPFLYRLRQFFVQNSVESVTVRTSQLSVCGSEGVAGCEGVCAQVWAGARVARVGARVLVHAAAVAAGAPADARRVLLQPTPIGFSVEATWEAWQRAEGGPSALRPTLHACADADRVCLELRPEDLHALTRVQHACNELFSDLYKQSSEPPVIQQEEDRTVPSESESTHTMRVPTSDFEMSDHYYKDDLRSGAFKLVGGGQVPMAYQVTLHGQTVAWRYPHPRAVTRIVAFPIPDQEEEIECVLEWWEPVGGAWVASAHFPLPAAGLQLFHTAPEAVFAQMWRIRPRSEAKQRPFEFDPSRYTPRVDPLVVDLPPEAELVAEDNTKYVEGEKEGEKGYKVSAEQLCGAVRVDSFFAPRSLPRLRACARFAELQLYLHNDLPKLTSEAKSLEGYYVSRPLLRAHRVLALVASDARAYAHAGQGAGAALAVEATLASDIMECATGAMEPLVAEFRAQVAAATRSSWIDARVRACATHVRIALDVPRLRTLHALADDWQKAVQLHSEQESKDDVIEDESLANMASEEVTALALEGRVGMWVHNTCACALRIGQDTTDERVPLGPGARLAYRWRSPVAPKALRIAVAGPVTDWLWSSSVPFTPGAYRVRLENAEALGGKATLGGGVYAHVRVRGHGARRTMRLEGRLVLANLLRYNLLYKVRTRSPESPQWQTVMSGELEPETVGRSVMCADDCEMALKIKFTSHDSGWSGDIPLKECPKENVPWLVKVPSEGELAYMSVWCRVVRARGDGRVLAAVWPLYVLYSHAPLDIDVTIETEASAPTPDAEGMASKPPALVQSAVGRGAATHLIAPGTTAARHSLSFQYRNIECPVTREAVPLHYGVTDTSVFDKRAPVQNIEDVVQEIHEWLKRCGRQAKSSWPYSTVVSHWPGDWQPALMQPRCDVNVWYEAVRAGGGCSLEVGVAPVALACSAAPLPLTLRAHDATPLCRLEPGAALAPPTIILQKPFFISMEVSRDTFVSGPLTVSGAEPGRYGAPPPGHLAPAHPAPFAIHCGNKVALLTMYYEIIHKINVLGISSTYEFINKLDTDVLVSAFAIPKDLGDSVPLRPKMFKLVKKQKETSVSGTPLARFWLGARWASGGAAGELAAFLCLSLPGPGAPASAHVPVRLAHAPHRRAFALTDADQRSVPVVVSQLQHEGRWVVTVGRDPCPQYAVHNHTGAPLAVAQPAPHDEPSTSSVRVVNECEGAQWHFVVGPREVAHYSSPAHCARYPPPGPQGPAVQFLTFARAYDDAVDSSSLCWCAPVAVTEGEQLVQLRGGRTLKLRVRPHPHSTLLELRDVDENDISASDIRNRLLRPHITKDIINIGAMLAESSSACKLQRESSERHLLDKDPTEVTLRPLKPDTDLGAASAIVVEPETIDNQQTRQEESASQEAQTIKDKRDNEKTPEDHKYEAFNGLHKTEDKHEGIGQQFNTEVENARSLNSIPQRSTVTIKEQSYVRGSNASVNTADFIDSETSFVVPDVTSSYGGIGGIWQDSERARAVVAAISLEIAGGADETPLVALHLDRTALLLHATEQGTNTTITVGGLQVDNLQYSSGQFDFAVVATAGGGAVEQQWPAIWGMFLDRDAFRLRREEAHGALTVRRDRWTVPTGTYSEITEVELSVGPLALYIEDAYVTALVSLCRAALRPAASTPRAALLVDMRTLQCPLRLRALTVHPLQLTLTLHTAVRMYIALDQSPLQLGAFQLQDAMTTVERLTHALTLHYLSAAILGAGWVVGGLELLGAPGALAARVGGAGGGVRGVAAAAAAALVRSLSAAAGSLARNLDLLAGDEEHARRAAAARRRHPETLAAGILAGLTNFAINILGAVGGLAHHPLVGVAAGEGGGAAALRRSLVGALAKPLSATADLLAYAGHGLLTQAGWHAPPTARGSWWVARRCACAGGCAAGWRRDCVRWAFRLAELAALAGFQGSLHRAPLALLLTHKFLVVADLETDNILEMIDLRTVTLQPYHGPVIELNITTRQTSAASAARPVEEGEDELRLAQANAAAMARVARYTGAAGAGAEAGARAGAGAATRRLALRPEPGQALALHAALATALRHNCDTHFPIL